MDELSQYYTARLAAWAVAVALLALLVPRKLVPYLTQKFGPGDWKTILASLLTSRVAIVVVLGIGHVVVSNWLWRIEHPELDFAGDWKGVTTYTVAQIGTAQVPFSVEHEVRIDQDCLSFALAPAKGHSFVNWGSLAINLVDKDTVRYAYWVNYSDPRRFPDNTKGYEEMHVTDRNALGQPVELTGQFFQCAAGQTPVYSGTVVFTRESSVGRWWWPISATVTAAILTGLVVWWKSRRTPAPIPST